MKIRWQRNHELLKMREMWHWSLELGQCASTYRKSCERLIEARGAFSLFYRINPFDGFAVDPEWDRLWRGELICEFETRAMYGYDETYRVNNEERPGTALFRMYRANAGTRTMLRQANSFADWQSPLPDNIAGYDWRGNLVFYSVGHELEVSFRKDLLFSDFVWCAEEEHLSEKEE